MDLAHAARTDALTIDELGELAGDSVVYGRRTGDFAERFAAAAREHKLLADAGPQATITRDLAARLIYESGLARGTIAEAWARGVGRVAPGFVKFAAGALGDAEVPAICHKFTTAANKSRRFTGVAYAGGVVTDHPFYERVAFDLSSTTFKTPAPILYKHEDPIGVVESAHIGGEIAIDGSLFADVDGPAKSVVAMADRGMPWQLSVFIKPGRVDQLAAGQRLTLNGGSVQGPLTIFRDSRIREVSFCALGADHGTSVQFR